MPGRYTLTKTPDGEDPCDSLLAAFLKSPDGQPKRYNIAPTQENVVIRYMNEPEASIMRWGLIPNWAKTNSDKKMLINARAETAAEKPSFRAAYQRRRCLAPADGFFEWKRKRDINQPFFFQMKDESVFYMAGIWESWQTGTGATIESYLLLTTRPNKLVGKVHDRMPVILEGEKREAWLHGSPDVFDPSNRIEFFEPISSRAMTCRPVSQVVNNATVNGPECLEPPTIEASTQLDMGF